MYYCWDKKRCVCLHIIRAVLGVVHLLGLEVAVSDDVHLVRRLLEGMRLRREMGGNSKWLVLMVLHSRNASIWWCWCRNF